MFEEPEGATPLSPDEMIGLKYQHITAREELDELEQANIVEGLQWVARRRQGDILQEGLVRALHVRLFGEVWEWAGTFRQREVNLGIDPSQISVQLRILLENARYWADENVYAPLEAGARFHHRMVEIHPFPNGNSRHARIAADIFLNDYYDHPPIDWADGFDLQVINERRDAYIMALGSADAGEFAPLLSFVGQAADKISI